MEIPSEASIAKKDDNSSTTNRNSASPPRVTSSPNPEPTDRKPDCYRNVAHEIAFAVIAGFAVATVSIMIGCLAVITDFVSRDLDMDASQISWLTGGNARLADMYGGKVQLTLSFFFFSVFSLAVGFAHNGFTMIILVCILGLLAASIVPPAQSLLSRAYGPQSSHRKNMAFSVFSAGFPLGFGLGMVTAGVCTRVVGWRGTFYFTSMIFFVASIICWFVTPNLPIEKNTIMDARADENESAKSEKAAGHRTVVGRTKGAAFVNLLPPFLQGILRWCHRMDLAGALLTIAGITLFTAPLTMADNAPNGWATGYIIGMMVAGIVIIGLFVCWELWVAEFPIIDFRLFRQDRTFSVILINITVSVGTLTPLEFYTSLYMQRVWGNDTLQVAVKLLPLVVAGIISTIVTGLLLHRVNNKLILVVAMSLYLGANVLLSVNRDEYGYWEIIFVSLCLTILGYNAVYVTSNMYIVTRMPSHSQAVAGGLMQTMSRVGGALGMAICTTVFNQGHRLLDEGNVTAENDPYYKAGPYRPYAMAMWSNACFTAASFLLVVVFVKIGRQGEKKVNDQEAGQETTQQ